MSKFYVYKIIGKHGELLYIGKGCNGRYAQHLNGCSSNKNINRYFFSNGEDGCVSCEFIQINMSEEDAFSLEQKSILELEPLFNIHFRPSLNPKQRSSVGKKQNFKELAEDYYNTYIELKECKTDLCRVELQDHLTLLKTLDKEFGEIVDAIGIEEIKSTSFHKTKSKAKYRKIVGVEAVSSSKSKAYKNLRVKEGGFYTYSELREKLQACFDKFNIKTKAKATDIKMVYNVKRTMRGGVEGFLIGDKI